MAMDAPQPAGGAVEYVPGGRDEAMEREELTPRAASVALPDARHHPSAPACERAALAQSTTTPNPTRSHMRTHTHAHTEEQGPYREEDMRLSLQLLAHLGKYTHVRHAFYKPRVVFNPALQAMGGGRFFSAFAGVTMVLMDKGKNRAAAASTTSDSAAIPLTQPKNIFSLVERFTFRPSPNVAVLPTPRASSRPRSSTGKA
ncbi:hypothetical protein JB92DRAFT_2834258 [Gautieria morchelliformis]|nr:hypothetical protein JB92DRAFT_2834258 [Gautieria morchelliformis]